MNSARSLESGWEALRKYTDVKVMIKPLHNMSFSGIPKLHTFLLLKFLSQ